LATPSTDLTAIKLSTVYTYNAKRHPSSDTQEQVCWYVAPPGECYYNTVLFCNYFSLLSVVSCTFSVLCM